MQTSRTRPYERAAAANARARAAAKVAERAAKETTVVRRERKMLDEATDAAR